MSWFSNLAQTYDRVAEIAGISNDGNVLLPSNHMLAKSDICVVIDAQGNFRRADESELRICIPCTEDSASRAGKAIFPHPLHDQMGYLTLDEGKFEAYIEQLGSWSNYHPKVKAIYDYIMQRTLPENLENCGIKGDDPKKFIRFHVETSDGPENKLWEDKGIVEAWQAYCQSLQPTESEICYATGIIAACTAKHPKGINASAYGAKLISSNDSANYTYRGRFTKPEQANSISASASHKAHAMLKYLVSTYGLKCDTQAIVAWAIDDGSPQVDIFDNSMDIFEKTARSGADMLIEAGGELDINYAKKLRGALLGMGDAKKLHGHSRMIAVMAMDAATTGRMGITFYQSLPQNEFLERVISWHEDCSWWFVGKDSKAYVSAPATDRIIAVVFGERKGEGYQKIKKQARERLLSHIICGEPLSRGWIAAAVNHVSRPQAFDNALDWEDALSATCAIVRKYFLQKKEEIGLALDTNNKDRSYLFGRLLALADSIEFHARGKSDTQKRPTNATRYMTAFAAKPMRTWTLIFGQLNPYIQKLDGATWFQNQIDEVMDLFEGEEYDDKPLSGKYLLGYSLQRRALMGRDKKEGNENESN